MGERRRSGLADMGQDLCDGLRLGEERDEGEGCLAGWADEGEDLDVGTRYRAVRRVGKGGGVAQWATVVVPGYLGNITVAWCPGADRIF